MIDHKNHYTRYQELMSLASSSAPARQSDGGYMAAIYILSSDEEFCTIARPKIGYNGICFSSIHTADGNGEMCLDRSDERRRRGMEQSLSQLFPSLHRRLHCFVL